MIVNPDGAYKSAPKMQKCNVYTTVHSTELPFCILILYYRWCLGRTSQGPAKYEYFSQKFLEKVEDQAY